MVSTDSPASRLMNAIPEVVYENRKYPLHREHHRKHSVWEDIAHGLHKASITILGILFVEVGI